MALPTPQRVSAMEPDEEEIDAVPPEMKNNDPLFNQRIRRCVDGQWFMGQIIDIEVGRRTQERLYLVKYDDEDREHLARQEAAECLVDKSVLPVSKSTKGKAKTKAEASKAEKTPKSPKAQGRAKEAAAVESVGLPRAKAGRAKSSSTAEVEEAPQSQPESRSPKPHGEAEAKSKAKTAGEVKDVERTPRTPNKSRGKAKATAAVEDTAAVFRRPAAAAPETEVAEEANDVDMDGEPSEERQEPNGILKRPASAEPVASPVRQQRASIAPILKKPAAKDTQTLAVPMELEDQLKEAEAPAATLKKSAVLSAVLKRPAAAVASVAKEDDVELEKLVVPQLLKRPAAFQNTVAEVLTEKPSRVLKKPASAFVEAEDGESGNEDDDDVEDSEEDEDTEEEEEEDDEEDIEEELKLPPTKTTSKVKAQDKGPGKAAAPAKQAAKPKAKAKARVAVGKSTSQHESELEPAEPANTKKATKGRAKAEAGKKRHEAPSAQQEEADDVPVKGKSKAKALIAKAAAQGASALESAEPASTKKATKGAAKVKTGKMEQEVLVPATQQEEVEDAPAKRKARATSKAAAKAMTKAEARAKGKATPPAAKSMEEITELTLQTGARAKAKAKAKVVIEADPAQKKSKAARSKSRDADHAVEKDPALDETAKRDPLVKTKAKGKGVPLRSAESAAEQVSVKRGAKRNASKASAESQSVIEDTRHIKVAPKRSKQSGSQTVEDALPASNVGFKPATARKSISQKMDKPEHTAETSPKMRAASGRGQGATARSKHTMAPQGKVIKAVLKRPAAAAA